MVREGTVILQAEQDESEGYGRECVSVCPEGAIPDDDPADVDIDLCSRCTSCINICPEDARGFTGDAFEATKPKFESANAERKEPEFYF